MPLSPRCRASGAAGTASRWRTAISSATARGRGIKAYPWRVAALCPECHVEIDSGATLSKQERRDAWDEAHRATVGELFRLGLIRPSVK